MPARAKTTRRTAQEGGFMADETATAATEKVEEEKAATEQPETDWKAKYEKAVAQSRKWEERSKANADKAKEYDAIKRSQMSEQEIAKEAQERADAAEAALEKMRADLKREQDAADVSELTGIPVSVLRGDTHEELMEHASAIKALMDNRPSAQVFASDGKRPGKQPQSPKDEFMAFLNNQM